ncbi:hypothetical protein B0T22DRAFT_483491 [Podospora appendiculata]|uniref:Required for respiratory growth protein 9, mitochondrial n=1 Tax=Podospora appendiculata TaxID=314037 RepID=A0AAE1C933_9PEZI|nr:hypothetical protein B0T22DRAFT_483491 [Podospora appendiculata]
MECTCRTAALRIFIRSVAQFQVPADATSRLPRCTAALSGLTSNARGFATFDRATTTALPGLSPRALHTTRARSDAAEDTAGRDASEPKSKSAPKPKRAARGAKAKSRDTITNSDPFLPSDPTANVIGTPKDPFLVIQKIAKSAKPRWRNREQPKEEPRDKKPAYRSLRTGGEEETETPKERETWRAQKAALKEKFPEGWNPRKKLSPDALAGMKALHQQFPEEYTTEVLANKFEVSPEAIRRILKSKWTPSTEEEIDRQERWFNRGKAVWTRWAELGKKPPRKWRAEGIVREHFWNEPRKPREDEGVDQETRDSRSRARAQRLLMENMM